MECKNCGSTLLTTQNFCSNCGAKVIRNRLTFKNLWENFTEQFLSVDNTFLRTFIHLFTKPEVVIGGYIDGVRKKYVNPIGYFAFSIILSGIMFYILKKGYDMTLIQTTAESPNMDKIYDYQAFLTYIGLPFSAFATLLIFIDKRKFNLPEHLVINAYWMAQYTIVQFLISIPLFGFFKINFTSFGYYLMIVVIIYLFYILKRLYKISYGGIVIRGVLYIPLYLIVGLLSLTPIVIYFIFTGDFTFEMFLPKK